MDKDQRGITIRKVVESAMALGLRQQLVDFVI